MAVSTVVCSHSERRSDRFLKLNIEDKKRYIAKLSLIDGIDPYVLPSSEFSEDTVCLPSLR